jgi:cobalt-zinc-cadmium efflux system membrane fusion protein
MHLHKEILALMLLATACTQSQTAKETANIRQENSDTLTVKENSPILKELTVRETRLQDIPASFSAPGTVRPAAGRLAGITPPFAGRIVTSSVRLGQRVSAGSPVFQLASPGFYDAVKTCISARSADRLARLSRNRLKDLEARGLASRKDLEQAESEALTAAGELEQATAILRLFNADTASLRTGQALTVTSPIAGEIIRADITVGDYVREDAGPLVTVADLSHVWVAASVREPHFESIRRGDSVEICTAARPGRTVPGAVHYAGQMLDEETRSLEVTVECRNPDRALKPGMFCEVRFTGPPAPAILLPATALMQEHGRDCVLVELPQRRYVRRPVTARSLTPDTVCITAGLDPGERVVVKGGIYLNR